MNQKSIKAFILLDVLFGLNLLLALVLLCGYFGHMVSGFCEKSNACRRLIIQFYSSDQSSSQSDELLFPATLHFEQEGAAGRQQVIHKKRGVFVALHNPHVASMLYVRFDEDAT
jgi:hypothetical protein